MRLAFFPNIIQFPHAFNSRHIHHCVTASMAFLTSVKYLSMSGNVNSSTVQLYRIAVLRAKGLSSEINKLLLLTYYPLNEGERLQLL